MPDQARRTDQTPIQGGNPAGDGFTAERENGQRGTTRKPPESAFDSLLRAGAGAASRLPESVVSYQTGAVSPQTGTVSRSTRCKGLVSARRAKATGEAQCTHRASENGFCKVHQYMVGRKGRGQKSVEQRYQKIGEALHVSPVVAMMTLLQESAGNVEYYRREVTKLEKLVIAGRKEREEVAKMVILYNEERDRLQRYTSDALRINLDARQVRLNEEQARAIVTVAKAIIEGIGLVGPQRENALHIAAQQLRGYAASQQDQAWNGPLQEAHGGVIEGKTGTAAA